MELAQGRKALVTGGASGFGREVARRLHDAGAAAAVVDIDADQAEAVASESARRARARRRRALAEQTKAADDAAVGELGGLDTAAFRCIFDTPTFQETTEEEWDRVLDVNSGRLLTAQASPPHLRERPRPSVMISSDAASAVQHDRPLDRIEVRHDGLAESIAAELAADNVTVNCAARSAARPGDGPAGAGGEDRPGREAARGDHGRGRRRRIRSGRTTPLKMDVAYAVIFFCSEHGRLLPQRGCARRRLRARAAAP